ncbi:S1C family serine protease [Leifsonia sp. Root227]|uniref:S1C family serine protease n=1 Tax=Leifsonia sp. Root227 TaxID=1736496 RepID=UPI0009ECB7E8|nr:trypsin-like peptidase domain-containing protein [Leifsonia sp. Root227]
MSDDTRAAGPSGETPQPQDSATAGPAPTGPAPAGPVPATPATATTPATQPASTGRAWLIAGLATAAALILIAGGFIAGTVTTVALSSRSSGACNAVSVADRVLPSIVTINVAGPTGTGSGSGQVISSDGYILTNNHVISPAASGGTLSVRFSDGHTADATLTGRDPKTDLAVIKVSNEKSLSVIDVGDSHSLVVGEPVVALGAPLGLSSTVTAGIVSALGRTVPVPSDDDRNAILVGAIQTDASINPGNSGGALVDCSGRLVGVNTAIATVPGDNGQRSTGSVGIGFAVPQAMAMPIAHELIDTGTVSYPTAGVDAVPIPHAVAQHYGVSDGLFVQAVTRGGPAANAGIRPGDIITSINGSPAVSIDVLTAIQVTSQPGDEVKVEYERGGQRHTTTVTLAEG